MIVQIQFRGQFKEAMLDGRKTMTCRTKRYGEVGDWFSAFDHDFSLTHVMRMQLGHVISDCFVQEGCSTPQELIEIWDQIHKKIGVVPEQIVWAHCFVRIT